MDKSELNEIELHEIEDLIEHISKSFEIQFHPDELYEVSTFGELSDRIINKIDFIKELNKAIKSTNKERKSKRRIRAYSNLNQKR